MRYQIQFHDDATTDLKQIYRFIAKNGGSDLVARSYVADILQFIATLDQFPMRATLREDIRPGLRLAHFARRVSIAFVVDDDQITILRILYAGQQFDEDRNLSS